nr:immunoglobulin heavy chain junction region [Mus musculus]
CARENYDYDGSWFAYW